MTVIFKEFRYRIVPQSEQRELRNILTQLDSLYSYHGNLQLMYNNSNHFTTINRSLCDRQILSEISKAARSRVDVIEVLGDVHENFHVSQMIRSAFKDKPLPVYDTYIRIKFNGHLYHLLILAPRLASHEQFVLKPGRPDLCDIPALIIPPIIQ